MKKVLITGANGFLGSHLVERGLKIGMEVHAAVRKTSDLSNLSECTPIIKYIDFDKEDNLRTLLQREKYDYIIHAAGLTKAIDKESYYKVNSGYTRKLIKLLHEENVLPTKFIFISSLASYGPADFQPEGIVSNQSIPHPVSEYGKSKLQAEQFVQGFHALNYIIFRPSIIYGPREKELLLLYKNINRGFELYIGDKEQNLSFIYIDDLVRIIYKSLDSKAAKTSYFASDGKKYSSEYYNSLIKGVLGKKTYKFVLPMKLVRFAAGISEKYSNFLKHPTMFNIDKLNELTSKSWECDITPLVEDLGFSPKFFLKKGIVETIKWNIENRNL